MTIAQNREKSARRHAREGVIEFQNLRGAEVTPDEIAAFLEQARPELYEGWEIDRHALGPSQVAGAQASQIGIDAQRGALAGLQQLGTGQQTEGDIAAMNLARMQQAEAAAGQRGAIQQRMGAQGLGGSGAELAGQLSAQQGGMNALAQQNAMLDQERSRRALAALQASGGLASNMRGQSFGEAVTRGTAADAFNMNNMDWRRSALGMNKDVTNQYNLFKAQSNIAQKNAAFDQQLGRATGQATAHGAAADVYESQAGRGKDRATQASIVGGLLD